MDEQPWYIFALALIDCSLAGRLVSSIVTLITI